MIASLENLRDSTGNQLELMKIVYPVRYKVNTQKLLFPYCVEIRKRIGNDRLTRAIKIHSQLDLVKYMRNIQMEK